MHRDTHTRIHTNARGRSCALVLGLLLLSYNGTYYPSRAREPLQCASDARASRTRLTLLSPTYIYYTVAVRGCTLQHPSPITHSLFLHPTDNTYTYIYRTHTRCCSSLTVWYVGTARAWPAGRRWTRNISSRGAL